MRVAIVGAGFGGIAIAIALVKAGIDDFLVFERSAGVGGVWRQNTYPGAACDVPSCVYSFAHDQSRDWSRSCSPQAEILDYLHGVAAKYGITGRLRPGTDVMRADFDDGSLHWELSTRTGEIFHAEVLVLACGQLNRPYWPQVPGRDEFLGRSFHSAEWDHSYDMRGKRVAVVGTGASAVQFVPEIAGQVARLHVFQRSAPWILPRRNLPYPAVARAAIKHTPGLQPLRRKVTFAVLEAGVAALTQRNELHTVLAASSRLFMRTQLRDAGLRRDARPDYPLGAKRILFSSGYLRALQRPNVELVTEGLARIGPHGLVTSDGVTREVDCVVYATGFKAQEFLVPLAVSGAGGQSLQDVWAGGARAHLGLMVSGYPNMFLLYGPNTNLGIGSIVVMLEAQAGFVIDALRRMAATGRVALDVREDVQRTSDAVLQTRLRRSVWAGAQSWYVRADNGRVTTNWPGSMNEYVRATRSVRPTDYRWLGPSDACGPEPRSEGGRGRDLAWDGPVIGGRPVVSRPLKQPL